MLTREIPSLEHMNEHFFCRNLQYVMERSIHSREVSILEIFLKQMGGYFTEMRYTSTTHIDNNHLLTQSEVCLGNIKLRTCCMVNASWLKSDIPVKTERLRIIGILVLDIFFLKQQFNTLQMEIIYFALPVLHVRR